MIDFTELPTDGTAFEQLVREILLIGDLHPQWTGKGPDQGRDIIATERISGSLAPFERRWLVQCKHFAHAGKSVGRDDLGSVIDDCRQAGVSGYLLACSTQPSSALVTKLKEIESNDANGIITRIWDSVDIEKRIREPRSFALGHLFFPSSFAATPWRIYNDGSPNRWTANYKSYFLHLSSRISASYPDLAECEYIFGRLESIRPNESYECIRPRAVFYDDKHHDFTVYADYLVPHDQEPSLKPSDFNAILDDGQGLHSDGLCMWHMTQWDIELRRIAPYSDHYNVDHYDFYVPYRGTYQIGSPRRSFISEKARHGDQWGT